LPAVEPWFDDPETRRWLGDRDWIRRAVRLIAAPAGATFEGRIVTGRRMWVALAGAGEPGDEPVGFVDAETYDRAPDWLGGHAASARSSAGLAWVVAPARRRAAIGSAMLRAALHHPEVAHVGVAFAGIEPANEASVALARRIGMTPRTEPDDEGVVYFAVER